MNVNIIRRYSLPTITIFVIIGFTIVFLIAHILGIYRESTCLTSLRALGVAIRQYTDDYDDTYPSRSAWEVSLPKQYPDIYCRAARARVTGVQNTGFYGYALNAAVLDRKTESVAEPKSTVLVFEAAAGVLSGSSPNPFPHIDPDSLPLEKGWLRHRNGSNYLFADGSARWFRPQDVAPIDDMSFNDGRNPSFNIRGRFKQ